MHVREKCFHHGPRSQNSQGWRRAGRNAEYEEGVGHGNKAGLEQTGAHCGTEGVALGGSGDHRVVERVADDHKVLKGHCDQEKDVHVPQSQEVELNQASHIGNGPALGLDIHQGLGHGGGSEKDVSTGQAGEEEAYGHVDTCVSASGQNAQVPSRSDRIHLQEQQEEDMQLLWLLWESPGEELKDAGLVPSCHKPRGQRKRPAVRPAKTLSLFPYVLAISLQFRVKENK